MNTKWKITLSLALLCSSAASAQAPVTVHGKVMHWSGAGESVAAVYAQTWRADRENRRFVLSPSYSAVTNSSGEYTLTMPEGEYNLLVFSPGAEPVAKILHVDQNSTVIPVILLKPAPGHQFTSDTARPVFAEVLRDLAGTGAIGCGEIWWLEADEHQKAAVNKCVFGALKKRTPFWVFYDHFGVDSDVFSGLVVLGSGDATMVYYDSADIWDSEQKDAALMKKVLKYKTCQQPIELTLENDGSLKCVTINSKGGK